MDYILLALGVFLALAGFFGCFVPVIPGPPLSFLSLLMLQFTRWGNFSTAFMVVMAVLAVAAVVLDYIVPAWGTKKFGGTKAGTRGSTIGLIVGVLVLPLFGIVLGPFGLIGILGGPFVGAYIGEKMGGTPDNKAWRSAFGSFIGFMAGTLMKIAYTLVIGYYIIRDIVNAFF